MNTNPTPQAIDNFDIMDKLDNLDNFLGKNVFNVLRKRT